MAALSSSGASPPPQLASRTSSASSSAVKRTAACLKTSLDAALRTLQSLKLIRAGGGGTLRAGDSDRLIELLPTLEVVVPGSAISEIAERLAEYDRSKGRRAASGDDDDTEEEDA
jgi:hypothetical protein